MRLVQTLTTADKVKWRDFCVEMQLKEEENNFVENFICDEATLHISGKVKRHNVHIWGTQQPHAQTEHHSASPNFKFFFAVSREKFHDLFFFSEATVFGNPFLDMLENWLLPQRNKNFDDYILHLHGASPFSNECTRISQSYSSTALERTCCKRSQPPSPLANTFAGSNTMRFLSLGVHYRQR